MSNTSYNGYPVIPPGHEVSNTPSHEPRLRLYVIPTTNLKLWALDGAEGFILAHWAVRFNAKIQPLNPGKDDWGYAYRAVRGDNDWSCHASGTALDFNAIQHPLGRIGTFKHSYQVYRIHRNLQKVYGGLIRWGGDYHGRKDEMHFEWMGNHQEATALAHKLMHTKNGKRILDANPGLKAVL